MSTKPKLGYCKHIDPDIFLDLFDLVAVNSTDDLYIDGELIVDAVLFGVGTDINPELYGQAPGRYTQQPDVRRDRNEKSIFRHCELKNIPMIGICRGAQLITALTGGTLIQHITGHAGHDHAVLTKDGRTITVNSYHHQMMVPRTFDRRYDFEILARTITPLSRRYLGEGDVDMTHLSPLVQIEPEVIVYAGRDNVPQLNCLAIQGHPEWTQPGSPFWNYTLELTEKYILRKERVNHDARI